MSTTKGDISKILRLLADEVDRGEQRVTFNLKAKKYPVLTAEKVRKQDEAARQGWVLDITSPSTIEVTYDSEQAP